MCSRGHERYKVQVNLSNLGLTGDADLLVCVGEGKGGGVGGSGEERD